ncbi:MAG: maleylpyruvate isomerase family mycothiol-dependent enzyme [Acidimicrobiales bacterium]
MDHLAHLRRELADFVAALAIGPLTAPVAACPGWDVGRLGVHMAFIHRWATAAVLTAASPAPDTIAEAPTAPDALVAWVRDGGAALIDALTEVPADAPTWHPFPAPQTASVWRRRQLQELTVHRWDAQDAIGRRAVIEPVVASDGIDEYFSMMLPRRIIRDGGELPQSSLHVHCTDTPGEWLVWSAGDELQVRRAHAKGDAALRGPAQALLLALWGRRQASPAIDVVGDPLVAEAWLALGG